MPNEFVEKWTKRTPAATPTQATVTGGMPSSLGGGATPEQIIQLVEQINQASNTNALRLRIPDGENLENLSSANIDPALRGVLPSGVTNMLGQASAERGVRTGSPGGPSTNADYLRSLGLTSLDLMNTGQNWLTQATSRNPAAPIYNAGNLVLTPQQQASIDLGNRQFDETVRSNQAQEAIARMRGASGGGGGGSFPRTSGGGQVSPAVNWPDLFLPQQTGNTTSGTGTFSSSWPTADPAPSWVMPQTTFADGTPNLGNNLMDGSLWGSIGYGAASNPISTGWDDFFDIGNIGSNSLYDYNWF